MQRESIELIGLLAAVLTTSSFVPQVYKAWKSKNVEGVSLTMYLVLFTGVVLWLVYGWKIESLAIISANATTALLLLIIIYLRIRYKKARV